jgi:hypothetical protein
MLWELCEMADDASSTEHELQHRSLEIDLGSPFGGFYLLSIMFWPFDLSKRREFLVTVAAHLLHRVESCFGDLEEKLRKFSAQIAELTGASVQQIRAELETKSWKLVPVVRSVFFEEIDQRLFRPSGGFAGVADAIGTAAIMQSGRVEGRKFGEACGEVLVYILGLHEHHRELVGKSGRRATPSLSRGIHIMENCARDEGRTLPAEHDWKTMWPRWGGIAPLWAAAALCETAAKSRGARTPSYQDIEFRQQIVAASLWIADFAVKFRPVGATSTLLQEERVIRLQCGLDAIKPEIPPLSDKLLAYACELRANR